MKQCKGAQYYPMTPTSSHVNSPLKFQKITLWSQALHRVREGLTYHLHVPSSKMTLQLDLPFVFYSRLFGHHQHSAQFIKPKCPQKCLLICTDTMSDVLPLQRGKELVFKNVICTVEWSARLQAKADRFEKCIYKGKCFWLSLL